MSPECSYILECAVELGQITPLEAAVLSSNTAAARTFDRHVETNAPMPSHWLRNTARQYLDGLPEEHRHVWALRGLQGFEYATKALSERIAFSVQCKVQADLGVTKRTTLSFIEEMDDAFEEVLFSSEDLVTPGRVCDFLENRFGESRNLLMEDLQSAHRAALWAMQDGGRRARGLAQALWAIPAQEPSVRELSSRAWSRKRETVRKEQRTARSAIKKAVRLFSRMQAEDSVRLLVHGHEVELSHPESPFKFVIQPNGAGWLEERTRRPGGHTPFSLKLLTKDNVYVSQLCVIFDNTPVLDQLLALTLFVQTGEEEVLLQKANWFSYKSDEMVRSLLKEKAPSLVPKIPVQSGVRGRLQDSHAFAAYEQERVHWEPYRLPVSNWVSAWLGEILSEARALKAHPGVMLLGVS